MVRYSKKELKDTWKILDTRHKYSDEELLKGWEKEGFIQKRRR